MKILFFGDIVGSPAREALGKIIPKWKKKYKVDLVIANGENMAHGNGVTAKSLDEVLKAGVDLVTLGDHTWDKQEISTLLEDKKYPIIRPANFAFGLPGKGYRFIQKGAYNVLVINLIGRAFMREPYDNPFSKVNEILDEEEDKAQIVIVDWHAEATSEKVCMGWHLDGRVAAVVGTHTHIPTADARVLPKGTAYITDVGMVGVQNSSLGMDKVNALKRMIDQIKRRLEVPEGDVEVNAVLMDVTGKGKAKSIKLIREIVAID